jgi:hypothetical protein
MQQRWERQQLRQATRRTLLFTHEQSKVIQREAQTRASLQFAKHKTQHVERSDEEVRTAAHFRESLVAARCGSRLLSGTQNSGAVSINARAQSPGSYSDAASVVLLYDESK